MYFTILFSRDTCEEILQENDVKLTGKKLKTTHISSAVVTSTQECICRPSHFESVRGQKYEGSYNDNSIRTAGRFIRTSE